MTEAELKKLEAQYCSWGDAVHSTEEPKVFASCEGSFLYDPEGIPYLDLQMASATSSFGYRNQRLNDSLKSQLDRLPQLGSHYLHSEKIELAARLSQWNEKIFGKKGRVHFNVGGSTTIDDAIKLVRNYTGKRLRLRPATVTGAATAISPTVPTSFRILTVFVASTA
jgi:4-aminobutyrate aminotransferase-like enzyme